MKGERKSGVKTLAKNVSVRVDGKAKAPTKRAKRAPTNQPQFDVGQRTAELIAVLEAKPGAVANPMSGPRASSPSVLIYKVMGKMFAILSIRGIENVILKCDPNLAHVLR